MNVVNKFFRYLLLFLALLGTVEAQNLTAQSSTTTTLSGLPDNGLLPRIDCVKITMNPASGDIRGKRGETVGWGFKVEWSSNAGDRISFTRSVLLGDFGYISNGTYTDAIGQNMGIDGLTVDSGTTWQQSFQAQPSVQGIGFLTIRPDAVIGAEYKGQIRVHYNVLDNNQDSPQILGRFTILFDVTIRVDPPDPAPPVDQVITFPAIADKTLGDASSVLMATSSSGLPVRLLSLDPSICTLVEGVLTVVAPGTCTIEASQEGDDWTNPALPISHTFEVLPMPASISLNGSLERFFDGTDQTFNVTTSPPGLPVEMLYNGESTPPRATGIYVVQAQIADATYIGSTTVSLTISVMPEPANNANLAALNFSSGALAPAFDTDTGIYTLNVAANISSIILTPTAEVSSATVAVNDVSVLSGNASAPINLSYGSTVIYTVVTAQDGTTTRSYITTVQRALPGNALTAGFTSATEVPLTVSGLTATGNTVNLSLGYAPAPGTTFMLVENTGADFINGTFSNLAQNQVVTLSFGGKTYHFIANYFGGTGNDLVLRLVGTTGGLVWGQNDTSQLGSNGTTSLHQPTAILATGALSGKTVVSLAVGSGHSLALCSDGTLAAWGRNAEGQLGNGGTTQSSHPEAVAILGTVLEGKTVTAIAAGAFHSLALCSDGTLAAWGKNTEGQLGTSNNFQAQAPVAVFTTGLLSGKTVIAISAGAEHSLALCSDGTLAAWGKNTEGQLGNDSTAPSTVPVAVNSTGVLMSKSVTAISAGQNHSLCLCADGTVVAWGKNSAGQLGNNSTVTSLVPVEVTANGVLSNKTVTAVSTGAEHSLALCSDGTLAAWGSNSQGHLGNNSSADSLVPVAVITTGALSGKMPVAATAGAYHNLALCSDGTLTAWGENGDGQLGNNTTTDSPVPVLVITTALAAGERFVLVRSGSSANHSFGLPAPAPTVASVNPTQGSAGGGTSVTITGTNLIGAFSVTLGGNPVSSFTVTSATQISALTSTGTVGPASVLVSTPSGTNPANTLFTFTNSAPTDIALSGSSIAENNPANAPIGTLSSTDPDPGNTFTYSFATGGADNGSFTIEGSTLKLTPSADFETKSSYAINIRSTDGGGLFFEREFTITITDVSEAVFALSGNGQGIAKDDATPGLSDHTGFGSTGEMGSSVVRTFTLSNPGTSPLLLTGTPRVAISGTHAAEFNVSALPASSVLAGGNTTFQITFDPSATGLRSAVVTLTSNDSANSPFTFAIAGTGLSSNADLASLTLGTGTLTPVFAASTIGYTATVPNATASLTFSATRANAGATLGGSSSPRSLTVGNNSLIVAVTAEDGITQKIYTVVVTRQTMTQTAVQSWAEANSLPPEQSGLNDDPDSDGKTNFEEFAFGTNPSSGSSGSNELQFSGTFASGTLQGNGQPVVKFESVPTGTDFRALFIRRVDHASAGLIYTARFSANMMTWQNSVITPSVLATNGSYQVVSVPYPFFIGGKKARFFQMSVTPAP
jgi:alpha-tubulin suppressor-like RCC1 family protein